VIAMTVIDIRLIDEAIRDDRLLERATMDAIEAMMRFAVLGRSIPSAITELDRLRQQFERAKP
jgi:hypothetical protein